MASRDLLEFHSGEPAGFMECAPVPLWRSPREMDGAGPRMKESSQQSGGKLRKLHVPKK